MIGNRNMRRSAKKRHHRFYFDISSTAALGPERIADPTCAIRVLGLNFCYTVATNGGTLVDNFRVGIIGTLTKYFNALPLANQAVNTVTRVSPSSQDIIPAGTTLLFDKGTNTGGTNTGECVVILEYELLDDTPLP